MGFGTAVLDWMQSNLSSDIMDEIMIFVSYITQWNLLWIGIAAILLILPKTRDLGKLLILALILSEAVTYGLKYVLDTPRPFEGSDISLLIPEPSSPSFPSSHSASAFAASTVIWMKSKRWGTMMFLFAAIVALSRLYLYVHYPEDVVAGAFIGILCAYAVCIICARRRGGWPLSDADNSCSGT